MNIKNRKIGKLCVKEYDSRLEMGKDAAQIASLKIEKNIANQYRLRVIFATAPYQNEFMEELIKSPKVDWSRIEVFHMDEYIGLDTEHPQSFATFLREKLFDRVDVKKFHYIQGNNGNA